MHPVTSHWSIAAMSDSRAPLRLTAKPGASTNDHDVLWLSQLWVDVKQMDEKGNHTEEEPERGKVWPTT
jgi:hypothetical protein